MRQRLPANWKLYWENLTDQYHAGLLHQFSTTFGVYRATQTDGSIMDKWHRHGIVYCYYGSDDSASARQGYDGIDTYNETLSLMDPRLIGYRDEDGDFMGLNLVTVFPNLYAQRISNTLATRQIRPKGPDEFELYWMWFGHADDDPELRAMRLRQSNLIGPAGLFSMEDGEAGAAVQRGVKGDHDSHSFVAVGGLDAVADQDHLIIEVPVRGFWHYYCHLMDLPVPDAPPWPATKSGNGP